MANPEDLGRYRLKRLLGRGALGQVWEASERDASAAKFAVKIMHAAEEELALARIQFAREARLTAMLRHPNVVKVHDAGEAAGTSFMVMEMVEGTPLRKHLGDASVTTAKKLQWIREMAEGIAALHGTGVIHRDLKPENVIVRADGTTCIVDLGIAKWRKFDSGAERDSEDGLDAVSDRAPPSTEFAPPEAPAAQLYDELGDQFAWGALSYALFTGAAPTEGSAPLVAAGVPDEIIAAIERARSAARESRWESMELVVSAIAAAPPSKEPAPRSGVSRTAPTAAPPGEAGPSLSPKEGETPRPPASERSKVRPLMLAGAAAIVLALVGLILAGLR